MGAVRLLPGIAVLLVGAVLARSLALVIGVNHLLLAIALGVVLANTAGIPEPLEPGIATHKIWLGAGIVLMGVSLTVETILEVGLVVLAIVLGVTGFTLVFVEVLTRNVFGLSDHLGSLLAAGTSICGVSAVVAVAGAIRAKQEHVAYAAGAILLFDAITIVVYPVVGDLLGLSSVVFGIWAGISMFSTGPVVAVGFAYSEVAGQWATMTKLARNTLIGVIALGYASYYAQSGTDEGQSGGLRTLWDNFPKFIVGFVVLVVVSSAGVLSSGQQASIEHAYNWLFLLAFVGLGVEIRLAELRRTGVVPVLVVLVALLVASAASLSLLTVLIAG